MSRTITERADALPALAEVFREYGFDGASLTLISKATALGKGSLYNFFPGGKREMAAAVLSDIDDWFGKSIFSRLEKPDDPASAIVKMFDDVDAYFRSGQRVCLVGSLGLGASRDPFAETIKTYFARWIAVLTACLVEGNVPEAEALSVAEEAVAGIQGAIVLSRALDDRGVFQRIIRQHRSRLLDAIAGSAGGPL